MITTRQTLVSEVLHLIEDATYEGPSQGATVRDLVDKIEKSETSVRKAVKELEDGGFVRKNGADGRHWRYVAVRKNEGEEVNTMAAETTNTKAETTSAGRGRPKDPAVQDRDAKVMALVEKSAEGVTVEEVAAALKIERNAAYLSIWRLRKAGQVNKTQTGSRTPRWRKG